MWVDQYEPTSEDELAVHKKKINEVSHWLDQSFKDFNGRLPLLLLTGEPGIGKTATVRVLCKERAVSIIEWINPTNSNNASSFSSSHAGPSYDSASFTSHQHGEYEPNQATQFTDFILRGGRYPTLDILSTGRNTAGSTATGNSPRQSHCKVLLVEDLPNSFLRDPKQFHAVLRRFNQSRVGMMGGGGVTPLVFILSDSGGGNATERALFPIDIRAELDVTYIRFNPVSVTAMLKALNRIVSIRAKGRGGGGGVPGGRGRKGVGNVREVVIATSQEELEGIASRSAGDLRTAINSLQFSTLGTQTSCSTTAINNFNNKQPSSSSNNKTGVSINNKVKRSSKMIGESRRNANSAKSSWVGANKSMGGDEMKGRDVNLSLFHALGKLLYCKRQPPPSPSFHPSAIPSRLPQHLSEYERDDLIVTPENIIDHIALSPDYFISFLQQNYVTFYDNVQDISCAAEYLSEADELTSDWSSRSTLADYSSTLAARAIAFCDSTRAFSATARRDAIGWRPLHRPQSLDAVKRCEARLADARGLFGFDFTRTTVSTDCLLTDLLPYCGAMLQSNTLGNKASSGGAMLQSGSLCNKALGVSAMSKSFSAKSVTHANGSEIDLNLRQKSFLVELIKFPVRANSFASSVCLETLDEHEGGQPSGEGDEPSGMGSEHSGEGVTGEEWQTHEGVQVVKNVMSRSDINSTALLHIDDLHDDDIIIESYDD